MRKEIFRMDRAEAIALLKRSPVVHLATTNEAGEPILRTVHGVVVDGGVAFHGAAAGEKMEALGRDAVLSAEETIASIPSYFVDPERACPATTFYRSVQVHGRVERVDDPDVVARLLAALMEKFQPEGGYAPIDARDPLYRKAIAALLVARVPLDRVDGKAKLGQNRTPQQRTRILEHLWRRGNDGDAAAIEAVLDACADTPLPEFLRGPGATRLVCQLDRADVDAAAALLEHEYWNEGAPREAIVAAQLGSTAWVGARAGRELIATARAISDGARGAFVYDVCVARPWRGRGLGVAVVKLLLDHPAVRGAARVRLTTRDAEALYERFGFRELASVPKPWPSTEMVLTRLGVGRPHFSARSGSRSPATRPSPDSAGGTSSAACPRRAS